MAYSGAETFVLVLEFLKEKAACPAAAMFAKIVAGPLDFEKIPGMRERMGTFEELRAVFD